MKDRHLIIGLDFDNTIVSYDGLFEQAASDLGLDLDLEGSAKNEVRDRVRELPDGEIIWQRIQGWVYGPGMEEARVIPGFESFVETCRSEDVPLYVVSHKTRFAAQNPMVSLRDAATRWMTRNGFFDGLGFGPKEIFFEATRKNKINRIADLACTHFVDDLVEVLEDESFPADTMPILFASTNEAARPGLASCSGWEAVTHTILRTEAAA